MKKVRCPKTSLISWKSGNNCYKLKVTQSENVMQKKLRQMVRDATHDIDDVLISLQAGQQTANRLNEPVAIQQDLSIAPLSKATMEVLEIIRPECYVKDGS